MRFLVFPPSQILSTTQAVEKAFTSFSKHNTETLKGQYAAALSSEWLINERRIGNRKSSSCRRLPKNKSRDLLTLQRSQETRLNEDTCRRK
jgi:hypothetical protein